MLMEYFKTVNDALMQKSVEEELANKMSLTSCLANVRRDDSKLTLADKERNYIDRANDMLKKITLLVFRHNKSKDSKNASRQYLAPLNTNSMLFPTIERESRKHVGSSVDEYMIQKELVDSSVSLGDLRHGIQPSSSVERYQAFSGLGSKKKNVPIRINFPSTTRNKGTKNSRLDAI